MFVLVVILAVALYVILKQVNRNLALTALFLRFGEGIIGGAILLLSGLIPLLLSKGEAVFEVGQFQTLFVSFLDIRNAGMDIVIIFMGIGAIIFFYLFFKSGFIPKAIAIWGMLTYLLMLILSFANILFPDRSEMVEIIHYGPGTLFEFIFGLFLLIKGIKVQ